MPDTYADRGAHARTALVLTVPMQTRRAAVVYNPTKEGLETLRTVVAAAEEAHGWEPSLWIETTEEDPGTSQARQAVEQGATTVIAYGGDGTVRAAVQGLHGTDAALGLVPAGTGNLLARNLHLPMDLDDAVEVAFAGTETRVDVATVHMVRPDRTSEDADFVVMAGVGIDAQMIANTDEDLKKKAGILAYVRAIVLSLRGGDRLRLRYRVDGRSTHRARVHSLIVGNCGELPANVALLPDAVADDGILDMVMLRPGGLLGWLQIAVQVLWHKLLPRRKVRLGSSGPDRDTGTLRYLRGTDVEVWLTRPEPFELDGDLFGDVIAFRCGIEPGALRVKTTVPPPEEPPGEPGTLL